MRNTSLFIVTCLFFSGCANTMPKVTEFRDPIYLIKNHEAILNKKIYLVPVIDTVNNGNVKVRDIKDISKYDGLQKMVITDNLQLKGYTPKVLDVDSRGCKSVANINDVSEIDCPFIVKQLSGEYLLFLSIDEFTPPSKLSTSASGVLSGLLYSKEHNQILWKDTIEYTSQSQIKSFGLSAYLIKLLSPTNKAYVYGGFPQLLRSLPNQNDT